MLLVAALMLPTISSCTGLDLVRALIEQKGIKKIHVVCPEGDFRHLFRGRDDLTVRVSADTSALLAGRRNVELQSLAVCADQVSFDDFRSLLEVSALAAVGFDWIVYGKKHQPAAIHGGWGRWSGRQPASLLCRHRLGGTFGRCTESKK